MSSKRRCRAAGHQRHDGVTCTAKAGHKGPHVARENGVLLCRWSARQSRAAEKTEPAREIEPGMPGFRYSGKRMTLSVDFPVEMQRYDVGDALNQIAQDIEYRGRTSNRKSEPKYMPKWQLDTNGADL